MASLNPLLELRHASFGYSPHGAAPWLFEDFNFQLMAGEKIALVGPNGCGKTTLLHLLVGLQTVQRGTVYAFGAPCRTAADWRRLRRRVGLVFQDVDDQLFCPTVLEEIAFGPLNLGLSHSAARQVAEFWLTALDLAGYESRVTHHLSGGEKRRVALASVLAMSPQVLLLDEPTAGLDQHHWQQLVDLLRELPQTLVIASHDHPLIEALALRPHVLRG